MDATHFLPPAAHWSMALKDTKIQPNKRQYDALFSVDTSEHPYGLVCRGWVHAHKLREVLLSWGELGNNGVSGENQRRPAAHIQLQSASLITQNSLLHRLPSVYRRSVRKAGWTFVSGVSFQLSLWHNCIMALLIVCSIMFTSLKYTLQPGERDRYYWLLFRAVDWNSVKPGAFISNFTILQTVYWVEAKLTLATQIETADHRRKRNTCARSTVFHFPYRKFLSMSGAYTYTDNVLIRHYYT